MDKTCPPEQVIGDELALDDLLRGDCCEAVGRGGVSGSEFVGAARCRRRVSRDPAPKVPSFMSRACCPFAPVRGGLQRLLG